MMKPFLAALSVVLWLGAAAAQAKTILIDVRTPQEFAQGHIPGAIQIDHREIGERISQVQAAKDDTIVVYCRSGRRSGLAQQVLQSMGYQRVENYGGLEQARARWSRAPQKLD